MERRWKRYAIFVSSTFIDMDAERDAIKFDVVSRLNGHFRSSMVDFQVVDLRSGINTANLPEELREDRVLDVCFSSIDSARPFFIGLLGDRYGWIPPKERIDHILGRIPKDKKRLLSSSDGLSVTELEMLYGAIGDDGKYLDHSLFYYRRPESYSGIPLEYLPTFKDDENTNLSIKQRLENAFKRERLRDTIKELIDKKGDYNALFSEYALSYDAEKGCFNNISAFADLVYRQLQDIVEGELSGAHEENNNWTKQETFISSLLQSHLFAGSLDRTYLVDSEDGPLFIGGERGVGKSVILSQLFERDSRGPSFKHIAFAGQTPFSFHIRTILLRWLFEMGERNDEMDIPDVKTLPDEELYRQFIQVAQGGVHSFYLDCLESLPVQEQGLPWINDRIPIVVAGNEHAGLQIVRLNPSIRSVIIPHYTQLEKEQVIACFSTLSYFDVPESILADLNNRDYSPNQLNLVLNVLTSLSETDYRQIRSQGGKSADINHYLEHLYGHVSAHAANMSGAVLERYACQIWKMGGGLKAFGLLAISPVGLRETDLEKLLGAGWDSVVFTRVVSYFGNLFILNPNSLCWTIISSSLKEDLLARMSPKALYEQLSRYLFSLPDMDMLKREISLYIAIKAHAPKESLEYLGTRKPYANYDEVTAWFFQATNMLVTDPEGLKDLDACCRQMNISQISIFLRHYYDYGCGFCQRTEEQLELVRRYLLNADIKEMDPQSSFALGWLMTNAEMYTCLHHEDTPEERESMLVLAMEAFRRVANHDSSEELDSLIKAARTMVTSVGKGLMDLYIEQRRFNDFQQVFNQLNQFIK